MSKAQICITKGKALITQNGLRCQGSRIKEPTITCNKLLVKKSTSGQISGSFKCERCGQAVEVEWISKP